MLNAEKYKEELKENGEYFAVSKNGKLSHCSVHLCDKCIFCNGEDCHTNEFNWLFEEYKEPIKLTRFEYDFLKNINERWKWIARDEDNYMCLYEVKPHKEECEGTWKPESPVDDVFNLTGVCFNDLFSRAFFDFVRWADEEPYNIKDILENCKVLDDE